MKIICLTDFDITATGVSGNHSKNRLPFVDNSGEHINDINQWNRSRNRQRNWETLQQILNLRTLLEDISIPQKVGNRWQFDFVIERASSIELSGDPLGALKIDCQGVPMILGLDEASNLDRYLIPGKNIFFEAGK